MVRVRTGDFAVEVARKGKLQRKPLTKVFRSRSNANMFAKKILKKGDGVIIDKINRFGQGTIFQRGLKGRSKFSRNVGKF